VVLQSPASSPSPRFIRPSYVQPVFHPIPISTSPPTISTRGPSGSRPGGRQHADYGQHPGDQAMTRPASRSTRRVHSGKADSQSIDAGRYRKEHQRQAAVGSLAGFSSSSSVNASRACVRRRSRASRRRSSGPRRRSVFAPPVRQPADDRHQRLEQAEVEAEPEQVTAGEGGKIHPGGEGDGKASIASARAMPSRVRRSMRGL